MRGIDISSWQAGINLPAILPKIDFCIVKATGGTSYVNPYCDEWVQTCINGNKPWGFYHFANDMGNAPAYDEADFFIRNCKNYFGHGIPVLDWERDSVGTDWINQFVNIVHSETGIWCWIYANSWRITEDVEQNCGRWIASYPDSLVYPDLYCDLPEPPYCNGLMCAWQFASDCRIDGYDGNLDASIFYGDETAWAKYAGYWTDIVKPELPPEKKVIEFGDYIITIEKRK